MWEIPLNGCCFGGFAIFQDGRCRVVIKMLTCVCTAEAVRSRLRQVTGYFYIQLIWLEWRRLKGLRFQKVRILEHVNHPSSARMHFTLTSASMIDIDCFLATNQMTEHWIVCFSFLGHLRERYRRLRVMEKYSDDDAFHFLGFLF